MGCAASSLGPGWLPCFPWGKGKDPLGPVASKPLPPLQTTPAQCPQDRASGSKAGWPQLCACKGPPSVLLAPQPSLLQWGRWRAPAGSRLFAPSEKEAASIATLVFIYTGLERNLFLLQSVWGLFPMAPAVGNHCFQRSDISVIMIKGCFCGLLSLTGTTVPCVFKGEKSQLWVQQLGFD